MDLMRRVRKLTSILDVAKAMTVERDLDTLLTLILEEAKSVVEADRVTIFVVDPDTNTLWSRVAHGISLREIRLELGHGIAGYVAQHDEVLNIPDTYADPRFNRDVDAVTGYRTHNMLCAPMRGARGEVVGVIQALNRGDGRPFDAEDTELLLALGGQAASAVQNVLLHEEIEALFEGFVRASVFAIEARDPTTSGHSERVADLTVALAKMVDQAAAGPFAAVRLDARDLREIRYASLLHDFGKVGVREHVLVKANKLYPWHLERMSTRFTLARVGLERDLLRAVTEGRGDPAALRAEYEQRLAELEEFWQLVEVCNRPTVLEEERFERLRGLTSVLVPGESTPQPLLTEFEVQLLSIPRGSLSTEERLEIESHVTHTFRFLSRIPWTKDLRGVPDIAFAHHEKLNGHGYPRGLGAAEIPIGSRMMAISDIYDALTATDRPYKKAVPPPKALDILHSEADRGLLDRSLLELFIETGVPRLTLGHEY